jgi:hypothetical protein
VQRPYFFFFFLQRPYFLSNRHFQKHPISYPPNNMCR